MDELLRYWPVLLFIGGVIVWGIRLEGLVKQHRETVQEFYATKQELAAVRGSVDGLGDQIADVKLGNQRIESKVDALLVGRATETRRTGG